MPTEQQREVCLSEDAALRAVVEGVEAETGERFFYSLVRSMASALDVRYAFVSEWFSEQRRARTRAVWGRGEYLENYEVVLGAEMPCRLG